MTEGNRWGNTALMRSASNGHLDVVHFLLKNGADINIHNPYGNTALSEAAYNRKLKIVQTLIVNGAKLDSQNEYGWTPLMVAANRGCIKIVHLLLQAGAPVDIQTHDGQRAYELTKNMEIKSMLIFFSKLQMLDKFRFDRLNYFYIIPKDITVLVKNVLSISRAIH